MAGPFARLRRGSGEQPEADAHTEVLETAQPDAPATGRHAAAPSDPAATAEAQPVEGAPADTEPGDEEPGFLERSQLRRRLRTVRRTREVALRDLGGLVFDLHRFGRQRTDLVDHKLAALATLDSEMRALESALDDRREVTVLHEPGLAGCPRCGALHASDAAFCSACGLPVGRGADMPAGPAVTGAATTLASADPGDAMAVAPAGPSGSPAAPQPAPADTPPHDRGTRDGEPSDADPASDATSAHARS
jgi:hypothetical protein